MSYQSSQSSTPSTSPSSSARSIPIGSLASATGSFASYRSTSSASPSWSNGSIYNSARRSIGSSFISDEDLFGEDDAPYLSEAPAPPRPPQAWAHPWPVARPLLPPPTSTKRRSSSGKERKHSHSSSGKK